MNDSGSHTSLEQALDHSFADPELLNRALRHRSWVAETGEEPSNERLEFLGDAILQLVVTDFIFGHFPDYPEGAMVKLRASAVSNRALSEVAESLGLGEHVLLGKGEEATGGRGRRSILGDAMEAVLGAVYLDGGLDPARRVILRLWENRIGSAAVRPGWGDYKSRLQELLARDGARPEYHIDSEGPDHRKVFTSVVSVDGAEWGSGVGHSKRKAQQEAARAALEAMEADQKEPG